MAVPQRASGPEPSIADEPPTLEAGVALRSLHPVVVLAWLLAGLAIAAGIGPWMSHWTGVMLPAFALVRTGQRPLRTWAERQPCS